MKIFTTKRDLRTWVDAALGSDGTEAMVDGVVDGLLADPRSPRFGEDWAPFLDSIESLWHCAEDETT